MSETKGFFNLRQQDMIIIFGFILVALITRIYGIWEWNLVGDEYTTVSHAAKRYTSKHNPAYYAVVLACFKLFGVSEFSARLPAALFGIISVPVFFLTWRNIFSRYTAGIGAVLIIFHGYHLYYSQFSRFYSAVFLFGSLSYYLYYQALRKDSYWYLGGALLSNLLGTLFHLTAALVPASCVLYSVFILFSKSATAAGYSKRIAKIHLIIGLATGLILSFFFWKIALIWGSSHQLWGRHSSLILLQLTRYIEAPLLIASTFGIIFIIRENWLEGLFFATVIVIPILALVIGSILIPPVGPRYVFYMFPLIFLGAAFLCERIQFALKQYSIFSHALVFILIASLLPWFVSQYSGMKSLHIKQAVKFIQDAYRPGDRILVFGPYHYYFGKEYPAEYAIRPSQINTPEWEKRVVQPLNADNRRVWILIAAYRKPMNKKIENWLFANSSLVWRKFETRYDYTVRGYQVFLMNGSKADLAGLYNGKKTKDISKDTLNN